MKIITKSLDVLLVWSSCYSLESDSILLITILSLESSYYYYYCYYYYCYSSSFPLFSLLSILEFELELISFSS